MPPSIKEVVMIAVSLMVIAIILPYGIGLLGNAGATVVNGSVLDTIVDPSIITLMEILIPILAVVGIAVAYVSYAKG